MIDVDLVSDALHERWITFRRHHPVGAYYPVGQLDGDCSCGRGAWPCPDALQALVGALEVGAVA